MHRTVYESSFSFLFYTFKISTILKGVCLYSPCCRWGTEAQRSYMTGKHSSIKRWSQASNPSHHVSLTELSRLSRLSLLYVLKLLSLYMLALKVPGSNLFTHAVRITTVGSIGKIQIIISALFSLNTICTNFLKNNTS